MMVGSTAENDQCGVCKGDNSTCRIIQGDYTEQPNHDSKKNLNAIIVNLMIYKYQMNIELIFLLILCHACVFEVEERQCLCNLFYNLHQEMYTYLFFISAYFPIALIPKTATSIKISEKNLSSNYLAIRDIYGNYYLNGQQQVAWPGEYMLGGAQFTYNRPYNEPETLESMGPLKEDIVLEVRFNTISILRTLI